MEKRLIKDYIATFQKRTFPKIIKRELKITKVPGKVITIIGPRRSGKTYYFFDLLQKFPRKKVLYLDFEEIFLRDLKSIEVLKIILEIFPEIVGEKPKYIFLDEIQNVKGWESLIRTLLDRSFNIFITGSSSKLLSREIATQLRGRTLTYILLPFSFREFLKAKNRTYNLNLLSDVGKLKKDLLEYLNSGGFPEVVLHKEKERIIKEYTELAFFKDFVERHKIKSLTLARYLFNHIVQNFSKEFSVRAMEKKLKSQGLNFDTMTLYKYVENLEDSLFFFFLKKFSKKIHLRESWPKKVYLCDTGLAKITKYSNDYGKLLENVVFLHLYRKINKAPLLEIFHYKAKDYEVDFLLKEKEKIKKIIQVSYISEKEEIEKREIKSLIKAAKEFQCKNLQVITWDYEKEELVERYKIKFIPLWKWLLEQ